MAHCWERQAHACSLFEPRALPNWDVRSPHTRTEIITLRENCADSVCVLFSAWMYVSNSTWPPACYIWSLWEGAIRWVHQANSPASATEESTGYQDPHPLLRLTLLSSLCEWSVPPSAWPCGILLDNSDTKMQGAEVFRALLLITSNKCYMLGTLDSDTSNVLFLSTFRTAQWVAEPGSESTGKPHQWKWRLPLAWVPTQCSATSLCLHLPFLPLSPKKPKLWKIPPGFFTHADFFLLFLRFSRVSSSFLKHQLHLMLQLRNSHWLLWLPTQ